MKLFLVGPRFDGADFTQFHKVAAEWRSNGEKVVSPAELDVAEGADLNNGWDGVELGRQYESDLFRRDIAELVRCDGIALLPGWQDDDDCVLMYDIANACNMTIVHEDGVVATDDELDYGDEDEVVGSARFHEVIRNIVELHNKKSRDYGKGEDPFYNMRASERYGIPSWVSCMIRSDDKSHRIQKAYIDGIDSLVNESVEDSFEDKIVYDILAYVMYREWREQ